MKTLIRNIGVLVSGDIRRPVLDADSLVLRDGFIVGIGRGLDEDADAVVDAGGTTVAPGLIDSHVHPVFGDFTPRQRAVDFIDSGMHGGVTTAISAGEVHLPGRPKDVVGLKALAVVDAKAYASFRPGGVKVEGGAMGQAARHDGDDPHRRPLHRRLQSDRCRCRAGGAAARGGPHQRRNHVDVAGRDRAAGRQRDGAGDRAVLQGA